MRIGSIWIMHPTLTQPKVTTPKMRPASIDILAFNPIGPKKRLVLSRRFSQTPFPSGPQQRLTLRAEGASRLCPPPFVIDTLWSADY
jgi:hypothetical protein